MRVCLMIEGQEGVTWDQWRSLAVACEEHGLDGLFRSDHYLSFSNPRERGTLDAWATLSALAAVTRRIRLGTMVSPATFRHPSVLAKSVVTVDHVSGGRVELGIGAGWFEPEHRAFGFPFPSNRERFDMFSEQVEIVHRLWSRDEEEVTFEGRHYRLQACRSQPKPVQDPHPPLILGGEAGPRAAGLAARWADEYNVHFKTPEQCARMRDRLQTAWDARGRDPATFRMSLMTGLLIGADRGELTRHAARVMERQGRSGDPEAFMRDLRPGWIAGTPDEVLDRLAEYTSVGIDRVLFQHLVHEDLDTIGLLGTEVVTPAADL